MVEHPTRDTDATLRDLRVTLGEPAVPDGAPQHPDAEFADLSGGSQLRAPGAIQAEPAATLVPDPAGNDTAPATLRRWWFILPVIAGLCAGAAIGVPAVLAFQSSLRQAELIDALRARLTAVESRLERAERALADAPLKPGGAVPAEP